MTFRAGATERNGSLMKAMLYHLPLSPNSASNDGRTMTRRNRRSIIQAISIECGIWATAGQHSTVGLSWSQHCSQFPGWPARCRMQCGTHLNFRQPKTAATHDGSTHPLKGRANNCIDENVIGMNVVSRPAGTAVSTLLPSECCDRRQALVAASLTRGRDDHERTCAIIVIGGALICYVGSFSKAG
jgi:hypothetical protein